MTFKASVAASAALFVMAGAAHAQSEPINFDLVNTTERAVLQVFISLPSEESWEEDIMGADIIPAGETQPISIDDGLPECEYDVKAVLEDGEELILGAFDFCEINGGELVVFEE